DEIEQYLANGFNSALTKPFDHNSFYRELQKYLTGAAPPSAKINSSSKAKLNEIARNYAAQLPDKLASVETALNNHDWDALARAAHKLASAGMFNLPEVGQIARRIEQLAANKALEGCVNLLTQLKNC